MVSFPVYFVDIQMSCFSCFSPRRKDVQNYDDDTGIRSAESSGFHFSVYFSAFIPFFIILYNVPNFNYSFVEQLMERESQTGTEVVKRIIKLLMGGYYGIRYFSCLGIIGFVLNCAIMCRKREGNRFIERKRQGKHYQKGYWGT